MINTEILTPKNLKHPQDITDLTAELDGAFDSNEQIETELEGQVKDLEVEKKKQEERLAKATDEQNSARLSASEENDKRLDIIEKENGKIGDVRKELKDVKEKLMMKMMVLY